MHCVKSVISAAFINVFITVKFPPNSTTDHRHTYFTQNTVLSAWNKPASSENSPFWRTVPCCDHSSLLEAHTPSVLSRVLRGLTHRKRAPVISSKVLPLNPLTWLELYGGPDKRIGTTIHIYFTVYVLKNVVYFMHTHTNSREKEDQGLSSSV